MAKNKKVNKKTKVLVYADAVSCATGFGSVSRNICEALFKTGRYDIDIFAINYWGDPHTFPYRQFPSGTNTQNDPYGRQKFVSMAKQMEYDILFCLQDTFILGFLPKLIPALIASGKAFKSICYFPIDGVPKEQWIKNVDAVDYLVAYSKFGANEAKKVYPAVQDMQVVPHGANIDDFKPLPKDIIKKFKAQYFGKHADKFIITNVNRNQHRKDIPRTIAAFVEFRKEVPTSILYLHMAMKEQGLSLDEVCKSYGLVAGEDVGFPENFGPNQGYPKEIVNLIYNVSDLVVSTTLGEGFGLSWVEAMATKTPVLMPNNTAMGEYITEDKGYLIDSGTTPGLHTVLPNDNEVIRPLVDVEDMAKKMVYIYNNYVEAEAKAETAYGWVKSELNWQGKIAKAWVSIFDKAVRDLKNPTAVNEIGIDRKVITAETF